MNSAIVDFLDRTIMCKFQKSLTIILGMLLFGVFFFATCWYLKKDDNQKRYDLMSASDEVYRKPIYYPQPINSSEHDERKVDQNDGDTIGKIEKPEKNIRNNIDEKVINISVVSCDKEQSYAVHLESEETVLDVMKNLQASDSRFAFQTKTFPFGEYVQSINSVVEDLQNGKYWFLYVNGKRSELGVSQKKVGAGDEIEWRLEE